MSVIAGVLFHAIGATSASLCYTPQRKVKGWSWQTFWLAQAAICWLVLPMVVAWITIPSLREVLSLSDPSVMLGTFLLGGAYGIGGTAFGIAIRYIGFSLTYAIAVGISCVLGTLLPPLLHGQLLAITAKQGSEWIIAGITIGVLGILLCGIAGRSKELDWITKVEVKTQTFSLSIGLPICILAGILSAFFGLALDYGQPIADIAAQRGAGNFQGNVIYIFSNTGAFLTTALYCIFLHIRENTWQEYKVMPHSTNGFSLPLNFGLAFITGTLWYFQFFFYGLGHVRMGEYKFSSWAIHMIMLVLFSMLAGLVLKEWKSCRFRTRVVLAIALTTLIAAVLMLSYGNYLADETSS